MKHKHILAIMLIVTALTSTGCLSMIYYPSRVLDSGGVYVGYGTHAERGWGDNYELGFYNSFFTRLGFGGGFAGGIELRGYQFLPYTGIVSIRKQFNFNAIVIDGITLGVGMGLQFDEVYGSVSLLKKGFSVTIAYSNNMFEEFNISNYSGNWLINSTYGRLSYEYNLGKHFIIMPFISYRYSKDTFEDEIWNKRKLGIGLSLAFKSK